MYNKISCTNHFTLDSEVDLLVQPRGKRLFCAGTYYPWVYCAATQHRAVKIYFMNAHWQFCQSLSGLSGLSLVPVFCLSDPLIGSKGAAGVWGTQKLHQYFCNLFSHKLLFVAECEASGRRVRISKLGRGAYKTVVWKRVAAPSHRVRGRSLKRSVSWIGQPSPVATSFGL